MEFKIGDKVKTIVEIPLNNEKNLPIGTIGEITFDSGYGYFHILITSTPKQDKVKPWLYKEVMSDEIILL